MDLSRRGCYDGGIIMSLTTALQRLPNGLALALTMAGTLVAGIAGGYAARFVHLPLPWLLGSLFTIAVLSLAGAPIKLMRWGRPAGMIVVGASTGLQFTAAILAKLVNLLPLMIAAAFVSTIVGALAGLLFMRFSGADRNTAFFATVPGGVVETTMLAPYYGAQLEPIMVAQTTRVAMVVVFAPFLVVSFVGMGSQNPLLAIPVAPWLPIVALLAASTVVSMLLARTRSPSAFLLPPLFLASFCAGMGWIEGRMPDLLLIAAQIVIGSSLGAQFRPEFLTRLHRLLMAAIAVLIFSAGSMALIAAGAAWLFGYSVPTMILAMAPAGLAEMVLTGKLLGLDAAVITGFQLTRIIVVLIWCRTALIFFNWLADRAYGPAPGPQ